MNDDRTQLQHALSDAGDFERRLLRLARLAASIRHDPRRLPQLFELADKEIKALKFSREGE